MNLIKLSAIPSTNDYLKELSARNNLPDFTVVVADYQTKGKGQMGEVWTVEPNSNLTFSLLLKGDYLRTDDIFTLNVMIANSVLEALEQYNLDGLYIKWPNDILSYNKKLGGILIENNIRTDGSIQSVVGIGVNILQQNFESLPKATSILTSYGKKIERFDLLTSIVQILQQKISGFPAHHTAEWQLYHKKLFKKDKPVPFEEKGGNVFMGMIRKVTPQGQLLVEKENGDLCEYYLKEIKMLY